MDGDTIGSKGSAILSFSRRRQVEGEEPRELKNVKLPPVVIDDFAGMLGMPVTKVISNS